MRQHKIILHIGIVQLNITNISVGSNDNINNDGNTNVIYAWAEIQGFSKMGTYKE